MPLPFGKVNRKNLPNRIPLSGGRQNIFFSFFPDLVLDNCESPRYYY